MNAEYNVGDGVTHTLWTDRKAATVVRVTPKSVTVRYDKAVLLNGAESGEEDALTVHVGGFAAHVEGEQRYSYEPDPEGRTFKFTRRVRKNGKVVYKVAGHGTNSPGNELVPGRHAHYDYNY